MLTIKKNIIKFYEKIMLGHDKIYQRMNKDIPNIMTFEETVDSILSSSKSLCRYGDGEFMIMNRQNIKFQKYNRELSKRLKEILQSDYENLLIALPDIFSHNNLYTNNTNLYWRKEIAKYRPMIYKLIHMENQYANAFVSRPYMNWEDKSKARIRFKELFKIWENKSVLIVEGEKTRMGVGNDIFGSVKSIKRILIPATNAFDKYEIILNEIVKNYHDELVLISAGPTAKVLVYDLNKLGIQAIDTGHLDIEYEWFLQSVETKTAIFGKYTAEVEGGSDIDCANDELYVSQIAKKIL